MSNVTATRLALVMPMAGRGSRFAQAGIMVPKPLVELEGRPFFWWAAESVRRRTPVGEMVFVVLQEHCRAYDIDARITALYPAAKVLAIADVTSGAAETARLGVDALQGAGPLAINDCDHAFLCPTMSDIGATLPNDADAALLCFTSSSPAYSYAILDQAGQVSGTIEKQAASPHAIAGCYMFASPALFRAAYDAYRDVCPYPELFVSGLFNHLSPGAGIARMDAIRHWSFGTPAEMTSVDRGGLRAAFCVPAK